MQARQRNIRERHGTPAFDLLGVTTVAKAKHHTAVRDQYTRGLFVGFDDGESADERRELTSWSESPHAHVHTSVSRRPT
jgi:hypothetical protein